MEREIYRRGAEAQGKRWKEKFTAKARRRRVKGEKRENSPQRRGGAGVYDYLEIKKITAEARRRRVKGGKRKFTAEARRRRGL